MCAVHRYHLPRSSLLCACPSEISPASWCRGGACRWHRGGSSRRTGATTPSTPGTAPCTSCRGRFHIPAPHRTAPGGFVPASHRVSETFGQFWHTNIHTANRPPHTRRRRRRWRRFCRIGAFASLLAKRPSLLRCHNLLVLSPTHLPKFGTSRIKRSMPWLGSLLCSRERDENENENDNDNENEIGQSTPTRDSRPRELAPHKAANTSTENGAERTYLQQRHSGSPIAHTHVQQRRHQSVCLHQQLADDTLLVQADHRFSLTTRARGTGWGCAEPGW